MMKSVQWTVALALVSGLVLATSGCPPTNNPPEGNGQVTTLIQTSSAKQGNPDVPLTDLESFVVTVTEVSIIPADNGNGTEADPVVLFTGSLDVNLVDLTDLAAVVSNEDIPAGDYKRAVINISNPRLELVDDPGVIRTDIQLTANGRLFVNEDFTIPEGDTLFVVDFVDLKLVQQGNGSFTLTPQLDAIVDISSAEIVATGVIQSIDLDAETFVLDLPTGAVVVNASEADLFLSLGSTTPDALFTDLAVGVEVEVRGTLFLDGSIVADSVHIVAL